MESQIDAALIMAIAVAFISIVGIFTLLMLRSSRSANRLTRSASERAESLRSSLSEANEDRKTREMILAAMDEGVVLVDEEGGLEYLNPSATAMLRLPQDYAGRPISPSLMSLATGAKSTGVAEDLIEIGAPPRIIRASANRISGSGQTLIVLRDVTQTTRVDAIRKDFAAAASHELKTPVASVRAAAETLCATLGNDPEASRRFAEQLLKDAERLSNIVTDLLDLSRLESELPQPELLPLDSLAREEVERLRETARAGDVTMHVEADAPVTVEGSRKDLSLAIRNLLENAVQYTSTGGQVTIQVSGDQGRAMVSISDTGIGIPSKDLPRIFERFYRVDRARSRETGGTGLGLALVKHVAETHRGAVEVESELGTGSEFRLILPTSSSGREGG